MINKVILSGRLTREPELRQSSGDFSVCRFSLAVDRRFQKQGAEKETDFFNCVAFRATADFCAKYFTKGLLVGVVGSVKNNNWQDNNGVKHYGVDVIVEEAHFLESKRSFENNAGASGTKNFNNTNQPSEDFDNDDGFEPVEIEDDLPF